MKNIRQAFTSLLCTLLVLSATSTSVFAHDPPPSDLQLGVDLSDSVSGTPSTKFTVNSGELYTHMNPVRSDGSLGFAREIVGDSENWQFNTNNRFTFWMKVPTNAAALATKGSHNFTFGTNVKRIENADPNSHTTGGFHAHHELNMPPTGTWTKVILNMHPSQIANQNVNIDPGNQTHPTGELSYNYFDTLTQFYLNAKNPLSTPAVYLLDQSEFVAETSAEEDDQIYAIAGTYVPDENRIIVTWNRHKDETRQVHLVRYAFTDIHESGWDAAINAPGNRIRPKKPSENNGMLYDSDKLPLSGRSTVYIAIKPQNSTLFTQIKISLTLDGEPPGGGDTTPPIISNVRSSPVTEANASITWRTDEPSDETVEYGLTSNFGSSATTESSNATNHSVNLKALLPGTLYHFRVLSRDEAGNLAFSEEYTFLTDPPKNAKPIITNFGSDATDRLTEQVGLQVYEGETVTFSANAKDNDGDLLYWAWFKSLVGGEGLLIAIGIGNEIPDTPYTYPLGSGGNQFLWTLQVSDDKETVTRSIAMDVTPPPELCAQINMMHRERMGASQLLENVAVRIQEALTGNVAFETFAPSDAEGFVRITDLEHLTRVANDSTTMYTITIKPEGHISRSLEEVTGILNGTCLEFDSFPVGDFDGDGMVTMQDLVRAVRYFQNEPDELLQSLYLNTISLTDLVLLLRNYIDGIQDQ